MSLIRKILPLFLGAAAMILASCEQAPTYTLQISGHVFHVEIANTPAQRQRGLMFRKSMPEDHGMLFIFPTDQLLSFWMKNTYIPLDIAYIAHDGTIEEIHHMTPHSLNPIQSLHYVRYALEVNAGAFEKMGIVVGDKVAFPPNLPGATD